MRFMKRMLVTKGALESAGVCRLRTCGGGLSRAGLTTAGLSCGLSRAPLCANSPGVRTVNVWGNRKTPQKA